MSAEKNTPTIQELVKLAGVQKRDLVLKEFEKEIYS